MNILVICLTILCIIEFIAIRYLQAENKYRKQVNHEQKKMIDDIYYGTERGKKYDK